jgi:hypothetical protein
MKLHKNSAFLYGSSGNYIKSFPFLHKKVLNDTEEELLIELYIHPTNDIIMELLKYSANVNEPQKFNGIIKIDYKIYNLLLIQL